MNRWLLIRVIALRRALAKERRYSLALERQLEGERCRNQAREDTLLNMVPHSRGLYGAMVREARATPAEPLRRQATRPIPRLNPWANLTEEERAEWPLYKADADPDGEHEEATRREFLQLIEFRRQQGEEIM